MTYVTNAFSAQMLGRTCRAEMRPVSLDRVRAILDRRERSSVGWQSCVGHADIAAVISGQVGRPVTANRVSVTLAPGDVVLVGQYLGPRMPEGATALPEGAAVAWYEVRVRGMRAR